MTDLAILKALRTLAASAPGLPLAHAFMEAERMVAETKTLPYMGLVKDTCESSYTGEYMSFSLDSLTKIGLDPNNALDLGKFLLTCPEFAKYTDEAHANPGQSKKINAIKEARALLWIGLKEAKDATEAVWPWMGYVQYSGGNAPAVPNPNYQKVDLA